MKKDIVSRLKDKIKPANRVFVSKNLAISNQISHILEQKGWSQNDLAKAMQKEPSEVSKLKISQNKADESYLSNPEEVKETRVGLSQRGIPWQGLWTKPGKITSKNLPSLLTMLK